MTKDKEFERRLKAAGATVELRQLRLQQNAEAMDRWLVRLLRAAAKVEQLRKERKRLMYPRKPSKATDVDWTEDKYIGSGGGAVEGLDDEVPVL
jgi:hypothetical protein